MAKAMGVNTIMYYIFWNAHEKKDGSFDFESPQNNLTRFTELVQLNGLLSAARAGPYSCGEWDYAGFPIYFLANRSTKIRTISD